MKRLKMQNSQNSYTPRKAPLTGYTGRSLQTYRPASRVAIKAALCAMTLILPGCLTAPPQPALKPLPTANKLDAPQRQPPDSYLVLCDPTLPTVPVPEDGESLSGELVWNTVLVGWSGAYYKCAISQARLVGWHEGNAVAPDVIDAADKQPQEPVPPAWQFWK